MFFCYTLQKLLGFYSYLVTMSKYLKIFLLLALLGFFSQGCNNQDNKTEGNRVEKCPYNVNGELEKAIKANTKAICLEPTYAHGYYERGLIYNDLGKTDKAIKNLEKAKSLWENPDYNRTKPGDENSDSFLITIENTLEEIK